jgi:hypothetical protein
VEHLKETPLYGGLLALSTKIKPLELNAIFTSNARA